MFRHLQPTTTPYADQIVNPSNPIRWSDGRSMLHFPIWAETLEPFYPNGVIATSICWLQNYVDHFPLSNVIK